MREIKSLPEHYVKAIDDRTVTGIFSVYGNEDLVGDIVWPGAFTKTLQEAGKSALFLWQHDSFSPPIAVINGFKDLTRDELPPSVLQKAPTALGGMEVTRTYLDTPRANEVLANIKAGVPLQASFAYDALKYDFTEVNNMQLRNLRELKLWEVSDVNWGANDATLAADGKLLWPVDALLKQLQAHIANFKTGARHSAEDMKMLNAIHDAAYQLGATNCKGLVKGADDAEQEEENPETEAGKSRAVEMTLTLARRKFQLLELETASLV